MSQPEISPVAEVAASNEAPAHAIPESKDKEPETEDLTLTPDDPSNNVITDADWKTVYTVSTVPGEHHSRTHTEVRNADGEVLASLEWHNVRPDKVIFGNTHSISMGEWMHRSLIPFDSNVTFKDDTGRKYKWKGNEPFKSLELYSEDSHYDKRTAWYVPAPRTNAVSDHTPEVHSKLRLTPRALEIRDTVVIAFLFLEKSRKHHEGELPKLAPVNAGLPDASGPLGGMPAKIGGVL